MSEYEQVIDEIVKHGVVVKINKVVDDNYIPCERKYVGCVVELDFSEHDKVFKDEIRQLKHELFDVQKSAGEYYNKCIDLTNQIEKFESELETKDNIQKINLNETIKVKLTPLGAEIYYKQFDELNKQYEREICKPQMPQIDKEGYTEFQLWHFIELYGDHIGMCKQNVIEPLDIVYCGNAKCHSDNAE